MLSKAAMSLSRSIVPKNPRESQGLSFLSWVVVDWGGGGGGGGGGGEGDGIGVPR